jgi:hypothetical protein
MLRKIDKPFIFLLSEDSNSHFTYRSTFVCGRVSFRMPALRLQVLVLSLRVSSWYYALCSYVEVGKCSLIHLRSVKPKFKTGTPNVICFARIQARILCDWTCASIVALLLRYRENTNYLHRSKCTIIHCSYNIGQFLIWYYYTYVFFSSKLADQSKGEIYICVPSMLISSFLLLIRLDFPNYVPHWIFPTKIWAVLLSFFMLNTLLRLVLLLTIGKTFDNYDQILSHQLRNVVYSVASSQV